MERRRSLVFTIAAACSLALLAGAPVSAAEDQMKPRVINGVPYPPLSGAAIALETDEGFYCSGSLWKSRIVATAAHCLEDADGVMITADQVTLWAPGADSTGPPSNVRVTSIIMDENWFNYAEDDEEAISRDLAFLVLDQPLGTPIWSRMATPAEVAALTWNGAKTEFVGYGSTTPTVDPNSTTSALPGGVNSRLLWGYNAGLGVFDVRGNPTTGTCGGDSGGPWMSRVGNEILYLGPLSGGQGLPCDKPRPRNETFDWGPVASANTDLVDVALAAAGESPAEVPRTCMTGDDIERTCWEGRAWEYDFCWSVKKAQLWKRGSGGNWNRVERYTAVKDEDFCGKKFPYRVVFRGIETKKYSTYEVYFPKQKGNPEPTGEVFKVMVS